MAEVRRGSWLARIGPTFFVASVVCSVGAIILNSHIWMVIRLTDHVRRIIKLEANVKELELRLDAPAHMLNLIRDEHGRRVLVDPNLPWTIPAGKPWK